MRAVNDVRALVNGAEQAAAGGDNAGAERLLRQALTLQEAAIGAQHPDVANTLNNLAIISEMNGKLIDAEACYRRAYAIAVATLPPTDPLVTTSRENLEEFCAAHGVTLKRPPAPGAASPGVAPPVASSAPPPKLSPPRVSAPPRATPSPRTAASSPLDDFAIDPTASPTPRIDPPIARAPIAPAAVRTPSRTPGIAAMLGILAVILAAGWYLFDSNRETESTASTPSARSSSPDAAPSPAPPSQPPQPVSEPEPVATGRTAETTPPPAPTPEPVTPTPAPTPPAASAPERPATTRAASSLSVVSAELCRSLTTSGAWRCTPATGILAPGPLVFYTKVASGRDATIEHRWYRDGRLHQRVPLRIRANPSGFRTFSRTSVTADRSGSWKVELRTQDGQLLDEKTFVVQP